ncbi:MAG TPA: hypothetical protein VFM59_02455, partial [Salinimicrobium sp.]|nr:hypothetical protein [Salinimicrobium sp.]
DLFQIIEIYQPDLIGIEIRPEDIHENDKYLKNFYPLEMRMVRDSFPNRVRGLDFYGNELKGELIPVDVFKNEDTEIGQYVALSQKMSSNSSIIEKKKISGLPEILKEQQKMALQDSAEEFMNGRYDSITRIYYNRLAKLLQNTAYEAVADFDRRRDIEITKNTLSLIEKHPGKKILILVGANHRGRIVDSLENKNVKMITSLDFLEK